MVTAAIGYAPRSTKKKEDAPLIRLGTLPRPVRCVKHSVSQSDKTKGDIGSDTLIDCETAKPEKKSAVHHPCKGPSERKSPKHDWEIAHQMQSSGTGLTIFPASTRLMSESVRLSVR